MSNAKEKQNVESNIVAVKGYLELPQNADQLKNFTGKIDKELTKPDRLGLIKEFSISLEEAKTALSNSQEQESEKTKDTAGLKDFEEFLNTCLGKNKQIEKANKKFLNIIKGSDNGMGRKVNIDEGTIVAGEPIVKNGVIILTCSISAKGLDGKNTVKNVTATLNDNGSFTIDKSGDIRMADGKYYNITGSGKNIILKINTDGFSNELKNYYGLAGADSFTTNNNSDGTYTVVFKMGDKETSFRLNRDGKILPSGDKLLSEGTDKRVNQDLYELAISDKKFTLKNTMKVKAETPAVKAETPAVKAETPAVKAETPVATILDKDNILIKGDTKQKEWHNKSGNNKLDDITKLIAIVATDSKEVKDRKTLLINLLNEGDLTGFQAEVSTKQDGLLGQNTLAATKAFLEGKKPAEVVTATPAEKRIKKPNDNATEPVVDKKAQVNETKTKTDTTQTNLANTETVSTDETLEDPAKLEKTIKDGIKTINFNTEFEKLNVPNADKQRLSRYVNPLGSFTNKVTINSIGSSLPSFKLVNSGGSTNIVFQGFHKGITNVSVNLKAFMNQEGKFQNDKFVTEFSKALHAMTIEDHNKWLNNNAEAPILISETAVGTLASKTGITKPERLEKIAINANEINNLPTFTDKARAALNSILKLPQIFWNTKLTVNNLKDFSKGANENKFDSDYEAFHESTGAFAFNEIGGDGNLIQYADGIKTFEVDGTSRTRDMKFPSVSDFLVRLKGPKEYEISLSKKKSHKYGDKTIIDEA